MARMRAVVQDRYGPPSVLRWEEIDRPVPGPGEVLVRLGAAAIHPGDYFVMTGRPYVVRLAFGLRRPRHGIPGRDLAGVVSEVGENVTDFRVGDAVFGWSTTGTLAQYVCVPSDQLVRVPSTISIEQAAAVPTSALTAYQAIGEIGRVRQGQRVLITGASGGVGSFAVQIAAALGADVTGVCSTSNIDLVRSIGATEAIDYTRTDLTELASEERRFDFILDNVEAQPLAVMRQLLTPTGTLIPNSGHGGRWFGPIGRIISARVRSAFTRQRLTPFFSTEKRADLIAIAALIEAGKLTPIIDRTYPLSEAAQALDYLAGGHTRGKVVITI